MMNLRFDHFITYTNAASIDDYRSEYETQGFAAAATTVRHEPGLRNGFVRFGPEYVEFAWVEDEALFGEADATEKLMRSARRPCGIGLVAEDLHALHAEWTARGHVLPAVWSKSARDAAPDAPPAWSFLEIPAGLLPGASCFALTYHGQPKDGVRRLRFPPNTVYAVVGMVFVAADPDARAHAWRDLLAPGEAVVRTADSAAVTFGPHHAEWMTADAYRARLRLPWTPSPHEFGELAALRLVATDLDRAAQMLGDAGRDVRVTSLAGTATLVVAPDPRDGFAFTIEALPFESWLAQRIARTGERMAREDA